MRKNLLKYVFVFLVYFVDFTNEIFMILDPYETRCISRDMLLKSSFAGLYYISGEMEEGNKAYIKDNNNQIIWNADGQKNGSFNLIIELPGIFIFT